MTVASDDELGGEICDVGPGPQAAEQALGESGAAMGGQAVAEYSSRGDMAADYRMLEDESCDWRRSSTRMTSARRNACVGLPVVLCLTNTTELDFHGQTITGLGL